MEEERTPEHCGHINVKVEEEMAVCGSIGYMSINLRNNSLWQHIEKVK